MTVTGIITAIIIGAIIGALGRLVVPGRQPIPIWLTIVVGIVAAFIGTALARALGISTNTSGIDWLELLVQVVIAAIGVVITANLWARRGVRRRRRRSRAHLEVPGFGLRPMGQRGQRTAWVQRNSATAPVASAVTVASHTCVVRPPCTSRARHANPPSRAVLMKFALSSTVVNPDAPSGARDGHRSRTRCRRGR